MPQRYTYTLFHTHCLGYAAELLEQVPELGEEPKMHRPAIGVIVLSAMAVEAAANHTVERIFLPDAVLERFPAMKEEKEKVKDITNPVETLKQLAKRMGMEFDKGDTPWQAAGDLHTLRSALVHYGSDPVITSEEGPVFWDRQRKRLKDRAKKLGLWSISEEEGGTWLDVFLNRPCARWALKTAREAVDALQEPPWMKE